LAFAAGVAASSIVAACGTCLGKSDQGLTGAAGFGRKTASAADRELNREEGGGWGNCTANRWDDRLVAFLAPGPLASAFGGEREVESEWN